MLSFSQVKGEKKTLSLHFDFLHTKNCMQFCQSATEFPLLFFMYWIIYVSLTNTIVASSFLK